MRRASRYLGYGLLALTALLVWAFGGAIGPELLAPERLPTTVQVTAMALAGALAVLAGHETRLTERVGWHRLYGLADVLLGLSLVPSALGGPTSGEFAALYGVAAVLGGLSLAFIGVDVARGGRHFDVDPNESA